MMRKEKEITNRKELDVILSKARICRIGFVDENRAYIVPMNFGYKNNCLYFHSALVGKKIDLIQKNTVVCFEVDIDHDIVDTGVVCNWSTKYTSSICQGNPFLLYAV
ncbi:MAG: pyridoxamine 5'-phosphate oxidase family protein [Euryarchaeota archaeon]|nr:pyridoxamine 5'-phosphate oxidase family protein [Euryarchaeota archaeon]